MKTHLFSLRWLFLPLFLIVTISVRAADEGGAAQGEGAVQEETVVQGNSVAPEDGVIRYEPVEEESDLDRVWAGVKRGASKTGHAIKTGSGKAADAAKRGYDSVVEFFTEDPVPENTPAPAPAPAPAPVQAPE